MLGMILIGYGPKKTLISIRPANILRRTGSSPRYNDRIHDTGIEVGYLLQMNIMLPAITEIVFINEVIINVTKNICHKSGFLADASDISLGIRFAEQDPPNSKLVQMRVGPA